MNIDILTRSGLTFKAAKIYLAALSLGAATVQELAVKAGLKRPTTYIHVAELVREGLLQEFPLGKKELYKPADPKILEARAEQHVSELKKALPDFQELAAQQGRPRVSILEGRKGLNQVYEEICQANNIRFWSDLSTVEELVQDSFFSIAEAIHKNEIRCREIIADTDEARRSSKHYAAVAGKTYTSRVATHGPGIYNDNVIYNDTLALFRMHRLNLFVILIKEPTIANTMKTLFDMAWERATPFIGR